MKKMKVLLKSIELIDKNNKYNLNLIINDEDYNMTIKKSNSLQNLYDRVRDEYKNIKINNTKADIIINEKEYWYNDIIDQIYICDKIQDKIIVIPEKTNILIDNYLNTLDYCNYSNNSMNNVINNIYDLFNTIFS